MFPPNAPEPTVESEPVTAPVSAPNATVPGVPEEVIVREEPEKQDQPEPDEQDQPEPDEQDEIVPPEIPEALKRNEEQMRREQEFKVTSEVELSVPLSDWSDSYTAATIDTLAESCGVSPANINITSIREGSTIIEFVVTPNQPFIEEEAEDIQRRLTNSFSNDFADTLMTKGLPPLTVNVTKTPYIEAPKIIPSSNLGCKRCRNGYEQAEHDHREFTRKCGRGGKCTRREPFSIKEECALGCADHCMSSCKRFHDPKVRKCASARRKFEQDSVANALEPSVLSQEAQVITHYDEKTSRLRQFIRESVEEQNLAQVSVVDARDRQEVFVLADCYADCSRQCVEHCIGEYGDPIPADYLKPEEEPSKPYNPPPLSPAYLPRNATLNATLTRR